MPCMNMTRRIKNTIYQVKVTVVDSDGSNMEDRIIHMIQNQPLALDGKGGILDVPQPSCRQPERMNT